MTLAFKSGNRTCLSQEISREILIVDRSREILGEIYKIWAEIYYYKIPQNEIWKKRSQDSLLKSHEKARSR
jgi:hypothetical protein